MTWRSFKSFSQKFILLRSNHATVDLLNKQIGNYSVDGKIRRRKSIRNSLSFQIRVCHGMKNILIQMARLATEREEKKSTLNFCSNVSCPRKKKKILISIFAAANFHRNEKIYKEKLFLLNIFITFFVSSSFIWSESPSNIFPG